MQKGKSSPRARELYEGTIHIQHQEITKPLREIAKQEKRSPEDVANEFLSYAIEEYGHFDAKLAVWHTLSPREQQVAALTCLGYTNQDIAQKLFISPLTVKAHIRKILPKCSANSKEQLRQVLKGMDFGAFDT